MLVVSVEGPPQRSVRSKLPGDRQRSAAISDIWAGPRELKQGQPARNGVHGAVPERFGVVLAACGVTGARTQYLQRPQCTESPQLKSLRHAWCVHANRRRAQVSAILDRLCQAFEKNSGSHRRARRHCADPGGHAQPSQLSRSNTNFQRVFPPNRNAPPPRMHAAHPQC